VSTVAILRPRPACNALFARVVTVLILATFVLAHPSLGQSTSGERPRAAASDTVSDVLRPGDVIRLRVWREPDLTGEFSVDETGTVVLPKVGPVAVTGDPSSVLKARIIASYARFLNHTAIDVTFLRRIQVLGAVRQPGVYPVDPTMTISDVLAVAGGTTGDGDPSRLELIRNGERLHGTISSQSLIGDTRVRSGDQIFVPERSWLRRNGGFLVGTVITASVSVLVAMATRR
jgi:polysaccharide export outer membrane protein